MADGAYDFSKADFLANLQEVRNRTFKPGTIISAWKAAGVMPSDRYRVLNNIKDALSSLTADIDESTLPGFAQPLSRPAAAVGPDTPETPPTIRSRFDWSTVPTPLLDVSRIQLYHDYVALRMSLGASVA